jgi:hypothetical protein
VTVSPLSLLSSQAPSEASSEATAYPERFPERTTLTRRDRVVARALAEAMFSQDGEIDAARLDAHLDDIDALISNASRPLRIGLRLALFVVRLAPVLFLFRMRMLESLSLDERVEVLARLERSRFAELSLAFIGWRAVMTFVVYEHPTELATLGYASERKVHKRRLAIVGGARVAAPARVPEQPDVTMAVTVTAPIPEESGVRLRGGAGERDRDSETPPAAVAAPKRHEVA